MAAGEQGSSGEEQQWRLSGSVAAQRRLGGGSVASSQELSKRTLWMRRAALGLRNAQDLQGPSKESKDGASQAFEDARGALWEGQFRVGWHERHECHDVPRLTCLTRSRGRSLRVTVGSEPSQLYYFSLGNANEGNGAAMCAQPGALGLGWQPSKTFTSQEECSRLVHVQKLIHVHRFLRPSEAGMAKARGTLRNSAFLSLRATGRRRCFGLRTFEFLAELGGAL